MNSQLKQRAARRMLTLLSKLEELKELGYSDDELNNIIPTSIHTFEQELTHAYMGLFN
jgi:hypothetical protein